MREARASAKAHERLLVEKSGGPVEWLRRRAPELLPLFPAGVGESEFFAESLGGWEDAAVRVKQCARCPARGGACDGSQNAWPDGTVIAADEKKGIRAEVCPKWPGYMAWKLLGSANVPEPFRDLGSPASLIPGFEDLEPELAELRRTGEARWFFVTGGDARRHRHVLIALARYLGNEVYQKRFWFDWTERIAVALRTHMNDLDAEDVRTKLRRIPILAVDHVNPQLWRERESGDPNWFAAAMDELLYSRAGKPTVIASSRTMDELAKALPLATSVIEGARKITL